MLRRVILLLALALVAGCRLPAGSPASPSAASDAGSPEFSAEAALCIDQTNVYRGVAGKSALVRSAALEEYATAAARTDGIAHVAHQYAHATNLGNGVSRAENAILWWSIRYYGSVAQIVRLGLADMWKQGEGGTHYRNLVGNYKETGCGIFVNGDEVTVVQAFR